MSDLETSQVSNAEPYLREGETQVPAKKPRKNTKKLRNAKRVEAKKPLSAFPPDPCAKHPTL